MELMPIIKMSFVLFSAVAFLIIVGSYISYKLKQKLMLQTVPNNKLRTAKTYEIRSESKVEDLTLNFIPVTNAQEFYIPQRGTQSKKESFQTIIPKERFIVVNSKQDELRRIEQTNIMQRAFYYPPNYKDFNYGQERVIANRA